MKWSKNQAKIAMTTFRSTGDMAGSVEPAFHAGS